MKSFWNKLAVFKNLHHFLPKRSENLDIKQISLQNRSDKIAVDKNTRKGLVFESLEFKKILL
ncbi:MAG: hypothetical protein HeimC3_14740 [Candidatus Heimdallarchaeota archaeon LC_3]|nr:MAG: hypothetical protein HeimC3_14740 [Candidatus Heimdallarchaeota archaeon LC_3]